MKPPATTTVAETMEAGSGDTRLTRAEVCVALGISKTTLRRWEDQGKVTPIVDARHSSVSSRGRAGTQRRKAHRAPREGARSRAERSECQW